MLSKMGTTPPPQSRTEALPAGGCECTSHLGAQAPSLCTARRGVQIQPSSPRPTPRPPDPTPDKFPKFLALGGVSLRDTPKLTIQTSIWNAATALVGRRFSLVVP